MLDRLSCYTALSHPSCESLVTLVLFSLRKPMNVITHFTPVHIACLHLPQKRLKPIILTLTVSKTTFSTTGPLLQTQHYEKETHIDLPGDSCTDSCIEMCSLDKKLDLFIILKCIKTS